MSSSPEEEVEAPKQIMDNNHDENKNNNDYGKTLPYCGQIIAGMVLLTAILTPPGTVEHESYGMAAAIVAMVGAGMAAAIVVYQEPLASKALATDLPRIGTLTVELTMAGCLFLWWLIAACHLTFNGPFTVTSNGYFACWIGTVCAAAALVPPDHLKAKAASIGLYNGLLVATLVQIFALANHMSSPGGETVYALVLAILTLVVMLALRAYHEHEAVAGTEPLCFMVFTVLWLVSACLTTFRGPFLATGNGYFSAWAATVLCAMLAKAKHQEAA